MCCWVLVLAVVVSTTTARFAIPLWFPLPLWFACLLLLLWWASQAVVVLVVLLAWWVVARWVARAAGWQQQGHV